MKFSQEALYVYVARKLDLITSNAKFWANFSNLKDFNELVKENPQIIAEAENIVRKFDDVDDEYGFICGFDSEYPVINPKAPNGVKPALLFYRGDISLLEDLNNVVAVIGLTTPTQEIEQRERRFVKELVDNGVVILSGLADGCDSISHKVCVELKSPTIAVLPSTLNKIFPANNKELAEDIVSTGGLLVTEYFAEPGSRNESVSRFVNRDKIQALFAKAVILTASYKLGEGDCGSRHAVEAAYKFNHDRYMMYNEKIDFDNEKFGLNRVYLTDKMNVKVLSKNSLKEILELKNPALSSSKAVVKVEELEESEQIVFGN